MRWLSWLAAAFCLLVSLVCAWLYYTLYWQRRACFDSEGRCFDEVHMVVYHDQSASLLVPALLFLLLCAIFLRRAGRRK